MNQNIELLVLVLSAILLLVACGGIAYLILRRTKGIHTYPGTGVIVVSDSGGIEAGTKLIIGSETVRVVSVDGNRLIVEYAEELKELL